MPARIAAAALVLCVSCTRPPDPLAEYRTSCERLQGAGQLKKGLSVLECAQKLKAAADEVDPGRRADEILERLAAMTAKGRGSNDASQKLAVRDAVDALTRIGKPIARPGLQRMQASADPDFRIAVARALVSVCTADCASQDYGCIVPALLEGTGEDKPSEVRLESEKGLMRCTGQGFGDDPAAWRKWYAALQQRAGGQASK